MYCLRRSLCLAILAAALIRAALLPGVAGAQAVKPFLRSFQNPIALASHAGALYVANSLSDSISQVVSGGAQVNLYATGVRSPEGLAFDNAGNLYVANGANGTVSKITPAKVATVFASGFRRPQAVAFDSNDNLYVADQMAGTVFKVTPDRVVSEFAKGFSMPSALAFDTSGNLYVADAFTGVISKVTPSGGISPFGPTLSEPLGLVFDAAGNLYVSEVAAAQITKITPEGAASVFVPSSAFAYAVNPLGLARIDDTLFVGSLSSEATLLNSGVSNTIFSISSAGKVKHFSPGVYWPTGVTQDADGNVFVISSGSNSITKIPSGKTAATMFASRFKKPTAIVADTAGNLYVADSTAGTVTKLTPSGTKSIFARNLPSAASLALDSSGNLYVGGTTGGASSSAEITKLSPAGAASVLAVLSGSAPTCLAINAAGQLYAFLVNETATIAQIPATGSPTTLVSFGSSSSGDPVLCDGMGFNSSGELYAAIAYYVDVYYVSAGIIKIAPNGSFSSVTNALNHPLEGGLLVGTYNGADRLIVTDTTNSALNYVYPADPPIAQPAYSMTKADEEEVYLTGSANGYATVYDWGAIACAVATGNLLMAYEGPSCRDGNHAKNSNGGLFRSDLGLTSSATLPSSGQNISIFPEDYRIAGVSPSPGGYGSVIWFPLYDLLDNYPPPPTSANQSRDVEKSAVFDLTAGSTGLPLEAIIIGTPVGGIVTGTPSPYAVKYTPNAGFTGIGSFTFVLQNYQGISTQAEAFVAVGVTRPGRPTVAGLSASSGATAGGTTLTISGSNLAGPAAVRFGLNPATITSQTASTIGVTVPTGSAGTVDVTVSTAGGTSSSSPADQYTYN